VIAKKIYAKKQACTTKTTTFSTEYEKKVWPS